MQGVFMGHLSFYNKNQIRDKLLLVLIFLKQERLWYQIRKKYYMLRIVRNIALCVNVMRYVEMIGHLEQEVPMETDSLYYIMDYSGHYYRTDKADQLVAVAGEQDATVFTFAQANSRICVGKKAAFYGSD